MEYQIPEKMDFKEAFEYILLLISKDPNDCINKSKDPNDCETVKTSDKKTKDSRPLIDQKTNELKCVNFYQFHNPLVKRKNIMEDKETRDFRRAVSQRAHNVWVNLEINRMIRFHHNNLKSWVREDKNVMFYVDNPEYGGGPKWNDVKIRQTFYALTGYMIQYKVVHLGENQYMKRLPIEDTKSKSKGQHPNKISHNKRKNK